MNESRNETPSPHLSQEILFRTITFTIYEQLYALNILFIRDIVMSKTIYCIPNSDPILMGVTNIRGEIIPVYSLKTILGYEDSLMKNSDKMIIDSKNEEYFIIIKSENDLVAINIDKIEKNISVTEAMFNDSSYMSNWSEDTFFQGVIIDKADNILMIDAHRLIELLKRRTKKYII